MERLRKSLNKITIISTLVILIAYIILYYIEGKPIEKFRDTAIFLALTSLSFVSSFLMLIIVAFEADTWFGDLKEYRLNLAIGCLVAAIFSAIDIVQKFTELFGSSK
jgi:hypothetical protein